MNRDDYQQWLDDTVARLADDGSVVGVVVMGSTADLSRVDQWSDHDIAIVTVDGAQDRFRGTREWMANADAVVDIVTEHHGGSRALFANGHIVEWGVTTVRELTDWYASDYAVLLDRGGVSEVMDHVVRKPFAPNQGEFGRDLSLFLITILHGCGRLRRGELLSANALIRGAAVEHLVRAARAHDAALGDSADRLDGLRRVEMQMPHFAERVAEALTGDAEYAARALVAVAESLREIAGDQFPDGTLRVVRERLGWTAT